MGIPCEYPTYVFGDNKSVLINSYVPHSVLKNKPCSVLYHYFREGFSNDGWRVAHVASADNRSDILLKPISVSIKRKKLASMIFHHIEWMESMN